MVLGDKTYHVVAQRKAYLKKKLPQAFSFDLQGIDQDAGWGAILAMMDENAYRLLRVFIPDLMPEHEFAGYGSEIAWKEDDYNEAQDYSPTIPQVRRAVSVCAEVNGLDLVKHLKNFISPDLIRAFTTSQIADLATRTSENFSATSTPDTLSTTSGTTDPTPEALTEQENGDSPSPASSPSSSPVIGVEPGNASS